MRVSAAGRAVLLTCLVCLAAAGSAQSRIASDIVVTNYTDAIPAPAGSLRAAVENAKNGDRISFARAEPEQTAFTIKLADTLTVTADHVVIAGEGGGFAVTLDNPAADTSLEHGGPARRLVLAGKDDAAVGLVLHNVEVRATGDNATLNGNTFKDRGAWAEVDGAKEALLIGNEFTGTQDLALRTSGTTSLHVTLNKFDNETETSVEDHGSKKLAIVDNEFHEGGGITLFDTADAVVRKNDFLTLAGIGVKVFGGRGGAISISDNEIRGDPGSTGIDVKRAFPVELVHNTIKNVDVGVAVGKPIGTAALVTIKRPVIEGAKKYGISFAADTQGLVQNGRVDSTREGPGIWVGADAWVRVSQTTFGDNAGPGIDLAPKGVTPNESKKTGNDNVDYPDRFKLADGKLHGHACGGCVVEVFELEKGSREGNPRNGEGIKFIRAVNADAGGDFKWPVTGQITCEKAQSLTFTATRFSDEPSNVFIGEKEPPVTSEFSRDVDCGAPTQTTPQEGKTVCEAPKRLLAAAETICHYRYRVTLDVQGTVASDANPHNSWTSTSSWRGVWTMTTTTNSKTAQATTPNVLPDSISGTASFSYVLPSGAACGATDVPLSAMNPAVTLRGPSGTYPLEQYFGLTLTTDDPDQHAFRPSGPFNCSNDTTDSVKPYAFAGLASCEFPVGITTEESPYRFPVKALGQAHIKRAVSYSWRGYGCAFFGGTAPSWHGSITGTLTLDLL